MSIQHMQMVFDAEGLSPREKCILLAYCNYTDAHGYVWAGVPRVSDDSGASESTVKRVRKELQERGLLATKRRVDPRTGRSTSNITRINLDRLAAMKRAPREYDDNVIEELLFDAEAAESKNPADLRIVQSDLGPDLRIGQSDPGSGVNLTPPKGGVNLTPNPSDEPSGSSSSGSADATQASNTSVDEEDETPSAGTQRGVLPMDLIVEATDATREEARNSWRSCDRGQEVPGGLDPPHGREGRPRPSPVAAASPACGSGPHRGIWKRSGRPLRRA
ncbi:helix-turn-helix domain-containing protein (plasmid) [Nocardiopsis sp. LDBS0036]|uniref:helix-turn-helix domain-containing protein n=1 Tax=Nocardiopsis sp. LDBS0036 TaxID=3104276 RepID=UPI003516FFE3